MIDGEPWFVAKDIASCLGWTEDNLKYHRQQNLSADQRGVAKLPTPRGMQGVTIISESGLYKLVMRSDKPQAKPFQDWVTREVLPSIRKTGAYVVGQAPSRQHISRKPHT